MSTIQPSLFPDDEYVPTAGKVRRDHPETSHAAAEGISDRIGKLQAKVLKALRGHPGGLTDEQLQILLKMNPSTQRPRRIELVEKRLVRDSGVRRPTTSGRPAIVWQIA
jgi:hypothetical protein